MAARRSFSWYSIVVLPPLTPFPMIRLWPARGHQQGQMPQSHQSHCSAPSRMLLHLPPRFQLLQAGPIDASKPFCGLRTRSGKGHSAYRTFCYRSLSLFGGRSAISLSKAPCRSIILQRDVHLSNGSFSGLSATFNVGERHRIRLESDTMKPHARKCRRPNNNSEAPDGASP